MVTLFFVFIVIDYEDLVCLQHLKNLFFISLSFPLTSIICCNSYEDLFYQLLQLQLINHPDDLFFLLDKEGQNHIHSTCEVSLARKTKEQNNKGNEDGAVIYFGALLVSSTPVELEMHCIHLVTLKLEEYTTQILAPP